MIEDEKQQQQQQICVLHLDYIKSICDYRRLICSLQTKSMGTVPDLNGIITTEVFAAGNDSLNERGKTQEPEKTQARFPIIAILVHIESENTRQLS